MKVKLFLFSIVFLMVSFVGLCGMGAAGGDPNEECSICLEARRDYQLFLCGHHFHSACIEDWRGHGNDSCPVCRAHLPSFEEERRLRGVAARDALERLQTPSWCYRAAKSTCQAAALSAGIVCLMAVAKR